MDTIKMVFTPHWADDSVSEMLLDFTLPASYVAGRSPQLHFPDNAYGDIVPFADYHELTVTDDEGEIKYEVKEAPSKSTDMIYRGVYFEREPKGTLNWHYRLTPRVLPKNYRSSPYFDFRHEPYGLNGSGFFAFMLPNQEEPLRTLLHWDLDAMPKGTRAIWAYGEGDVDKVLTPDDIAFSVFNVGVMNAMETDDFGIYWFGDVKFDMAPIFKKLSKIFEYMKNYFHDQDSRFSVFLRRDPFEHSGGGSACRYAFISGYSDISGIDPDGWFRVLVHEMTHTWPTMVDDVRGEGTWFEEGCTEYYCTALPYKGGFVDAQYTADCLNNITVDRYWNTIYRNTPNLDIAKIQWKDRIAQPVPYGRGMMYLANVNAQLHRAGKGNIDGIVMARSYDDPLDNATWERFVEKRLGQEGVDDFHAMCNGELVKPDPDAFGPELVAIPGKVTLADGRVVDSYHWEARKGADK